MIKKIIKLINNERIKPNVRMAKACTVVSGATDVCVYVDQEHCTTYAFDKCGKDYNACSAGADDVCSYIDYSACSGPGAED